jgi:hypothetical protein
MKKVLATLGLGIAFLLFMTFVPYYVGAFLNQPVFSDNFTICGVMFIWAIGLAALIGIAYVGLSLCIIFMGARWIVGWISKRNETKDKEGGKR